jgi:hypothetical protein
MNPFWAFVAAWVFFSHKARQERKKDNAIYDRAIRDAAEEHSAEQQEYEQFVNGLPKIKGPETFNARVNTHFAEDGVIERYAEYLDRQFYLGHEFVAVLEFEKDNPRHEWAIRVEVSQATFGYLHHPYNQEICKALDKFGGEATCLARIARSNHTMQYEVFLDLDVSLIIGFAPQEQVLNESEFEGSLENLP